MQVPPMDEAQRRQMLAQLLMAGANRPDQSPQGVLGGLSSGVSRAVQMSRMNDAANAAQPRGSVKSTSLVPHTEAAPGRGPLAWLGV